MRPSIPTAAVAETTLGRITRLLAAYSSARAFNQYAQAHPDLDRPDAADIRMRNLQRYLELFSGASLILIGEAAGYAGCRFSGIPFTCEAQICGPVRMTWAVDLGLHGSSLRELPWEERSARVVWGALGDRRDCLLWNAFPWHPCGTSGPLSNGDPGSELRSGMEVLRCLLAMVPRAQPIAVGRVAQHSLAALGVSAPYIRHPSHGGRRAFEAGIARL